MSAAAPGPKRRMPGYDALRDGLAEASQMLRIAGSVHPGLPGRLRCQLLRQSDRAAALAGNMAMAALGLPAPWKEPPSHPMDDPAGEGSRSPI